MGNTAGPEIEPVGPMIWSTSPGVKLLTCMGRSNVTLSVLVVPLVIRLSAAGAGRHRGAHDFAKTCGPGTISGSVFWLNGGWRMEADSATNVTAVTGWGVGTA